MNTLIKMKSFSISQSKALIRTISILSSKRFSNLVKVQMKKQLRNSFRGENSKRSNRAHSSFWWSYWGYSHYYGVCSGSNIQLTTYARNPECHNPYRWTIDLSKQTKRIIKTVKAPQPYAQVVFPVNLGLQ